MAESETESIQVARTKKFSVVVAGGDIRRKNLGTGIFARLDDHLLDELTKLNNEDLFDLANFLEQFLNGLPMTFKIGKRRLSLIKRDEIIKLIKLLDEISSFILGLPILADVWRIDGKDPRAMLDKCSSLEALFVKTVVNLTMRNSLTASFARNMLARDSRGQANENFPWIRDLLE